MTTPSAWRSLHHCSPRSEKMQRAVDKLITLLTKVCRPVSRRSSVGHVRTGRLVVEQFDSLISNVRENLTACTRCIIFKTAFSATSSANSLLTSQAFCFSPQVQYFCRPRIVLDNPRLVQKGNIQDRRVLRPGRRALCTTDFRHRCTVSFPWMGS